MWENILFPPIINPKILFRRICSTHKNADSVNVRFVRIFFFLKSETLPVFKKKKFNSCRLYSFLLYFEAGRTGAEFGRLSVRG